MDINKLYTQAGSIGQNGSFKFTSLIENIPVEENPFPDYYNLGFCRHYFNQLKTTQISYNAETFEVTLNDITDYSSYPSIGIGAHAYSFAEGTISNFSYFDDTEKFDYTYGGNKCLTNNVDMMAWSMRYIYLNFAELGYETNSYIVQEQKTLTIAQFMDFLNGDSTIDFTINGLTYNLHRSDFIDDYYYDIDDTHRIILFNYQFDGAWYFDGNTEQTRSYRPDYFLQSPYMLLDNSYSSITFGQNLNIQFSGVCAILYYNSVVSMYSGLSKNTLHSDETGHTLTTPIIGGATGKFQVTDAELSTTGSWKIISDESADRPTYVSRWNLSPRFPFGILTAVKFDDVYKNAALYRWTLTNIYGYGDGTNVWFPKIDLNTNEYLLELIQGTEEEIEPQLPLWWKIGNIQANDYVDDDKPTPSDKEDDPSGVPTNDKKGKEKITKDTIAPYFNRFRQVGNTVSFYALTASNVSALRTLLMIQSDSFYDAVKKIGASSFYEFINSLRFWPINFDVSSSNHNVYFANEPLMSGDSPVQYKLLTNPSGSETINYKNVYICYWDLANLTWENNFLDYEPYTKLTLTLPYAGTFDLDLLQISAFGPLSSAFLKLYGAIDFETGVLCYCLALSNPSTHVDMLPLLVKQVKIAVDIALNANNATAQSDAILNAGFNNIQKTLNLVNAGTKMVTTFQNPKAKVGNKIGATTGVIGAVADSAKGVIDYANATRAIPITIGANSGSIASAFYCQLPYLSHYHPRVANPDNYGSAIGYLWEGTATIKSLSGFSIARNPNLSNIQATEEEKNLISEILTTGFYA